MATKRGEKDRGSLMPAIETRLKDLLDETRLAMLGTQLLMGLQYNAAFAQRFIHLPDTLRRLDGVALLVILTTAAFLLATPSYHQIAAGGHATSRMLMRASNNLKIALLPLSLALGIEETSGSRGTRPSELQRAGIHLLRSPNSSRPRYARRRQFVRKAWASNSSGRSDGAGVLSATSF
jgi:hypothetical protein